MTEILDSLGNLGLMVIGIMLLVVGEALVRRYLPVVAADRQLRLIGEVVDDLVRVAERAGQERGWDGELKREFVIQRAAELMARRGIEVTEEEIDLLIERALYFLRTYEDLARARGADADGQEA